MCGQKSRQIQIARVKVIATANTVWLWFSDNSARGDIDVTSGHERRQSARPQHNKMRLLPLEGRGQSGPLVDGPFGIKFGGNVGPAYDMMSYARLGQRIGKGLVRHLART